MGGTGLSSQEISDVYKAAGVKERFKSLVDAEQGTTEHIASILHDRDAGLHLLSPSVWEKHGCGRNTGVKDTRLCEKNGCGRDTGVRGTRV